MSLRAHALDTVAACWGGAGVQTVEDAHDLIDVQVLQHRLVWSPGSPPKPLASDTTWTGRRSRS
eukprot:5846154-Pyramimonas_sp.AAC.2